jgi:hypothetical protein
MGCPPMRTVVLPGLCLVATAILAGCGSASGGNAGPGDPPGLGNGTTVQVAVRNRINAYRVQQSSAVYQGRLQTPLNTSAVQHAGYQAIKGMRTYYETVDGTSTGAADTTAALYAGVGYYDRAAVAYNAFNLANGTTVSTPSAVDERIPRTGSTAVGTAFVDELWLGIYGRLPLMRQQYALIGYGDRDHAAVVWPAVAATGDPMTTLDLGRDAGVPRTVAGWPNTTAGSQPGSYDPANDTPAMGTLLGKGVLGRPVHYIHPTSSAWTKLGLATITPMTSSGGGGFIPSGSPVPVYLVMSTATTLINPDWYKDSALVTGELFLVPKSALAAGRYQVDLSLSAGVESINQTWQFTISP